MIIHYLIIFVFLLTAAIASGSIVIASRMKMAYKSDFFSSLLFFLVFYNTFGFYAIWGELTMMSFLSGFASQATVLKIADLLVILGSPFLIVASLMFVKFARELSGRKTSSLFILIYLIANLLVLIGIGIASSNLKQVRLQVLLHYYLMAFSILFTLLGNYYFLFPGKTKTRFINKDLTLLSVGIFSLMAIQNFILLFSDKHVTIELLFLLFYFTTGSFPVLYIKYKADLSQLIPRDESSLSFDSFCELHTISPREKEIIHEICEGLSNQQIADRLFISLQTVKDHTHRIYGKANCSSRAQLIRMVNEVKK